MSLRRKFVESLAQILGVPPAAPSQDASHRLSIVVVNQCKEKRWVTVEPTGAGDWHEPATHCRLDAIADVGKTILYVYVHEDGVCVSDEFNLFYRLDYDYDYGSQPGDYSPAA